MRSRFIQLLAVLTTLSLFTTLSFATTIPPKLPQTGQTTSYATGDDGDLQSGMPWPDSRFTENGNGTVTDNLTGLIWLKNANCFGGQLWATAIASVNGLANGQCELADDSTAGQWRLPNINELSSLLSNNQDILEAWLNSTTQGFSGVMQSCYVTSTSYALDPNDSWYVEMKFGSSFHSSKTDKCNVWPVRGGQ